MKTLLILALLTSDVVAMAADKPSEGQKSSSPKAYPLKTCIVTDNDLDSMGEQASFVHQGQTIKVCCKPCIAKFEKNPAKYLKKLEGK
jgi:YHS domain-containing protein